MLFIEQEVVDEVGVLLMSRGDKRLEKNGNRPGEFDRDSTFVIVVLKCVLSN